MMIFHSYVSLPEGILHGLLGIIITHIVETPINQGMGRDMFIGSITMQ